MTTEELEAQLLTTAKKLRLGVFFDRRALRAGQPWIIFRKNDCVLAEFHDLADSLAWLPKTSAPHAN